jgi:hypothetical protein
VDPLGLKENGEENIIEGLGMLIDALGSAATDTGIPIIKHAGRVVSDIGDTIKGAGKLLEGVLTLDVDKIKEGGKEVVGGLAGVVGLGPEVKDDWVYPRDEDSHPDSVKVKSEYNITGGIPVPESYAKVTTEGADDWRNMPDKTRKDDSKRGFKRWHAGSNAIAAADASLAAIPKIAIIGLVHEIEPLGISAEIKSQGFSSWVIDTPGDIIANTVGIVSGLFLPRDTAKDVARCVGGKIPGPPDSFKLDDP